MKAIVFYGHEDLPVEQTPDAALQADTDIVLMVVLTPWTLLSIQLFP